MEERVLLPQNVSPIHYTLEITPDFNSFEFSGVEDVDVIVKTHPTYTITIHSREILVSKCTFRGTNSDVQNSTGIEYDSSLATLTLKFKEPLPLGEGNLHIEYKGILNNVMAGFYRSKYVGINGEQKYMASTQFEALDARRALPCWDEPAVKATFSVIMVIPSHMQALSNMPELSCVNLPNKLKRVVFDKTPVMSTYLLAFAVGEFDMLVTTTVHNVTIRVFTPPGRGQQGLYALNMAKKCLEFYDDFFQIPYPLPKLDMLVVTEFAAGAMENWGLVTYRESALLIADETTADITHKQRVALVIAHELAHQWFGNLVTMTWWCDLWLNEGFASFMQYLAVNRICPEWRIWEQYTMDTFGLALKLDSLRSSHPIQVPIKHAEEVEEIFDSISYAKGSTVVRMAQYVLGYEMFQKGLQQYMQTHKYNNTETYDLWNAWTEVSQIDMNALMNSWTTRMGYPYVTVLNEVWSATHVTLTFKQNWYLADGSGTIAESGIWNIPLGITVEGIQHDVMASMREEDIVTSEVFERTIGLSHSGAWVKLNSGQGALMRCAHSSQMIQRLLPAIKSKNLSAIDRASLLDDSFWLCSIGEVTPDSVITILSAFSHEDNPTVWKCMIPIITSIHSAMSIIGGECNIRYKSFLCSILLPAVTHFGWDNILGESELDKLTRGLVFSLLPILIENEESLTSEELEILAESRRRFSLCVDGKDDNILSSDIKASVFRIVLQNGTELEYNKVLNIYQSTTEDQIRKWAITTLGAIKSPDLKLRCLHWAISGNVKLQDCYTPMASVSGSSNGGPELAWKFFKDNLDAIKELLSTAIPWIMNSVIVACASKFHTLEMANEIELFFHNHPNIKAERTIKQTVEKIRINCAINDKLVNSNLANVEFWKNL